MQFVDWKSKKNFISSTKGGYAYGKPTKSSVKHERQTLMVNAANIDNDNRPVNAPWLVDLELPRLVSMN